MSLVKDFWRGQRRRSLRAAEVRTDRRLNITTIGDRFDAPPDPHARNARYEPFTYAGIRQVAERLRPQGNDVFYDIGCGKGRVLCWMAQLGTKRCVGVEYDAALADIAQANADALVGRRASIEIVTGDAAQRDYAGATIAFMYNPFGAEVMRTVLAKLSAIRDLRIVYAGPVHAAVFAEFANLRKIDEFFAPYDLGRVAVQIWQA